MKTIGTLRMKEIMIIEESNKEKDRSISRETYPKIIIIIVPVVEKVI